MESGQVDRVVAERDQLRHAINKIATLRQQELENQKNLRTDLEKYKRKTEQTDQLIAENKKMTEEAKGHQEKLKLVSSNL